MDLYAYANCSCAVENGNPDRRNQMIETYKGCEEPLLMQ